jgi:galactonate dehydratase
MAGGEMCSDPVELEPSLGRGGLHVVLPDVKHAGGLRQAQRLAALAAAHGASVSPHNPTSPVGTAASLHLAGLVPNLLNLEFAYGETEWRPRTTVPTEEPRAGTLRVPTGPGLGITTNEDLIHFQAIGGKR